MASGVVIPTGIFNPHTELGARIVFIAEDYAKRDCRESSTNRGVCIDEIHEKFNGKPPKNEPWCAKFAYVCNNTATNAIRSVATILPQTASAIGMLNAAEKLGIVNDTPCVGATYYRYSGDAGSTGHIGVVKGWNETYLFGVEGNVNNRVWWNTYELKDLQKKGFRFIHAENQFGTDNTDGAQTGIAGINPYLGGLLLGALIYAAVR